MSTYFQAAINEAQLGVEAEEGAPFGACIAYQGSIIASAHDTVLKDGDATCHAEINAIRQASKKLNNYRLSGCVIYCTSEPCPMCFSAIHWAGIEECHFILDRNIAATYGFDDAHLYKELCLPLSERNMRVKQHNKQTMDAKEIFEQWRKKGLPLC